MNSKVHNSDKDITETRGSKLKVVKLYNEFVDNDNRIVEMIFQSGTLFKEPSILFSNPSSQTFTFKADMCTHGSVFFNGLWIAYQFDTVCQNT